MWIAYMRTFQGNSELLLIEGSPVPALEDPEK